MLLESIDKYAGSARRVEETGRGNSVVAQFGSKNRYNVLRRIERRQDRVFKLEK